MVRALKGCNVLERRRKRWEKYVKVQHTITSKREIHCPEELVLKTSVLILADRGDDVVIVAGH